MKYSLMSVAIKSLGLVLIIMKDMRKWTSEKWKNATGWQQAGILACGIGAASAGEIYPFYQQTDADIASAAAEKACIHSCPDISQQTCKNLSQYVRQEITAGNFEKTEMLTENGGLFADPVYAFGDYNGDSYEVIVAPEPEDGKPSYVRIATEGKFTQAQLRGANGETGECRLSDGSYNKSPEDTVKSIEKMISKAID